MPRNDLLVWLFAPYPALYQGSCQRWNQSHGARHSGKYCGTLSLANILQLTSYGLPFGEEPEESVLRSGVVTSAVAC